jgi:MFS family permease
MAPHLPAGSQQQPQSPPLQSHQPSSLSLPARTPLRLLLGISSVWLALSILGDGINSLVLPAHLLASAPENGAATLLGVITFTGLVAGMLVQPLAGQWSDRLRPRYGRHVFVGGGLLLVLVALLGLALAPGLPALFGAYLLLQIAVGIAQAAQQGYIPDLVPAQGRGLAAGWKGMMDIGGATIGFLLLGALLGGGSIAPALLAIAGSLLVAYLLAVLLVREPALAGSGAKGTVFDAFRLDVRRHPAFARVVAARFLFLFGTYAVGRFLLLFVADRLGLTPDRAAEEAGMLLALLTLVTALGAPLGGWAADRWGRIPLMAVGALLSAAGVLGLIAASTGGTILLFGVLMSFGSAAFASANWAMTTDLAPPHEAARFMGLANFGTAGGAAAAGLLGPVVDWGNQFAPGRGYTFLFAAAAAAFLASLLVLRRRDETTPEVLPLGEEPV